MAKGPCACRLAGRPRPLSFLLEPRQGHSSAVQSRLAGLYGKMMRAHTRFPPARAPWLLTIVPCGTRQERSPSSHPINPLDCAGTSRTGRRPGAPAVLDVVYLS